MVDQTLKNEARVDALIATPGRGARAITTRLRRAIESGIYANGDQLPPERHLATAFEASRSTIRKALNNLESDGLVVRRVGSGTFVDYAGPLQNDLGDVTGLISPLQLIEARIAVERHMTRLAAIHATGRDLDNMAAVLKQLEASGGDKDEFTRWDSEFHLLLARCSRNPLIVHLYQQINEVRSHAQWAAMKDVILTPEEMASYNVQHRQIYDALRQHDAQKALDCISQHLEKARQDLIGAESEV